MNGGGGGGGGGLSGSGAATQVPRYTGADTLGGDADLTFDGVTLAQKGAAASTCIQEHRVTGDADVRHEIQADGTTRWGGGASAVDVAIARGAANRLDLASGDGIRVVEGYVEYGEAAAVPGGNPSAALGKVWLQNTAPNVMAFTDDAGVTAHVGRIFAKMYASVNQAVATATWTSINYAGEDSGDDPLGLHSTSADTHKIIVVPATLPGIWIIIATVRFAANATGQRGVRIGTNGGGNPVSVMVDAAASGETYVTAVAVKRLVSTDFVLVQAFQSSGGNLNVETDGSDGTVCSAVKVG